MKTLNKFIITISIILLIISSLLSFTLLISFNKYFYLYEFEKNDTANDLSWTDENKEFHSYDSNDLNIIITRIISYLSGKGDSLQFTINDNNVFSNQTIFHMQDVKNIFNNLKVINSICLLLFTLSFLYIIINRKNINHNFLKQTYITSITIFILFLIGLIIFIFTFDDSFYLLHHVLFPSNQSFNDSIFYFESNYPEFPYINNLLLTNIFSYSLFVDATIIILVLSTIIIIIWLLIITLLYKKQTIH